TFVFAALPVDAPAPAAAQTAPTSTSIASGTTQYLRCVIHPPFPTWFSSRGDSDPFSLGCRWKPAQRQALDDRDGDIEHEPEQTGDDDPCPGLVELKDPRPCEDQHTERVEGPAEVLTDDRADHRAHGRDLQAAEDERQRARDPHAAEDRPLAGCVGMHQ